MNCKSPETLQLRIEELEKRIKEQDKEIQKLNKKAKRSSFWLFWLLSKEEDCRNKH